MAAQDTTTPPIAADVEAAVAAGEQTAADVQAAVASPGVGTITPIISDAVTLEHEFLPVYKETKAGWKTTEFWSGIAIAATDVASGLPAHDKLLITILGAVYAVARGIAKNGIPATITGPPQGE